MNSDVTPFWQESFAEQFLSDLRLRSVLVTQPGQGKSQAIISLWKLLRQKQIAHKLLVITSSIALKEQWQERLRRIPGPSASDQFIVENVHKLGGQVGLELDTIYQNGNALVVIDEAHALARSSRLDGLFQPAIIEHPNRSQVLYLATATAEKQAADLRDLSLDTAYIYEPVTLGKQTIKKELARFSPSQTILQRFWSQGLTIDDLNWRQFETLVAELLEKDGYSVDLMKGTKDGGVDVVAIKKDGMSGYFKTVWQAKKHKSNKVQLHIIRELADTVHELKASKGIIITTTFLTAGALARVKRDQYVLGKVERPDLERWIYGIPMR